jgi:hypothetical protein
VEKISRLSGARIRWLSQGGENPAADIAQPLEVVIQTAMNDKNHSSRLSAIEYLGRHAREEHPLPQLTE